MIKFLSGITGSSMRQSVHAQLPVFVTSRSAWWCNSTYREISNVRRTKSPNLNVSRLVLQLPLYNVLKPCVKSWMKMEMEQRQQAMLQLHLSDQQFFLPSKVRFI